MLQCHTIREVLEAAVQRLTWAGCNTPRLDAEVLLAHVLDKDRTWLYLWPEFELDRRRYNYFSELVTRRERREPVAYLTGLKSFFGLEFLVNSDTLIPRPETELLVETALQLASHNTPLTIADIGTGSGCIAIALATHLAEARIFAIDISPQAIQMAWRNAERHQVLDRITFLIGNLLLPLAGPVDFIVSNPPYIRYAELRPPLTMAEVYQYEPHLALDGGLDGLLIIRRLLAQAREKLKPEGTLLVEIGATQGDAVRKLAATHFPEATITIKKDLAGLDRLLVVQQAGES
jgi:release factor glutamine methyltransferase